MEKRIVVCEEQEITERVLAACESDAILEHCDTGVLNIFLLKSGEILVNSAVGKNALIKPL